MSKFETQAAKKIHGFTVTPKLAEDIERALEMMRRVRTAQIGRGKRQPVEFPRTKFVVPEPLVYPVSPSRDRQ